RVPPAVEEKHVFAELEVESDAAGAVAHQDYVLGFVFFELLKHGISLFGVNFPVILQRNKTLQLMSQDFQAFHPLAKDDRLFSAGRDFLEVGAQPFELRAFAGDWVEVADLLEAQD